MKYSRDWPFRQDDERWAKEVMWDRKSVVKCHIEFNNASKKKAENLLRKFRDGNTIGNEGCLLTCLAMVLKMLHGQQWNPACLHKEASRSLYYSLCGLAMVTLYADIVSDVSGGEVQLCLKEEYLSGEKGWPPVLATESIPLRAYLSLPKKERENIVAMVKTGTYDDTVASHYVLVDPLVANDPNDPDIAVLDPAMPLDRFSDSLWKLSDSAKRITEDQEIKAEWKKSKINPLQIGGVWLFARWHSSDQVSLLTSLARALTSQDG